MDNDACTNSAYHSGQVSGCPIFLTDFGKSNN